MFTRTKIICTIGPSVCTYTKICSLIDAGMNVARLNCSHGDHESHGKMIALLKRAREEKKRPLALLLDLRGPKVCIGDIQKGAIPLKKGQILILVKEGDGISKIEICPFEVTSILKIGTKILFDDGVISSKVVEICSDYIAVEIQNPGVLKKNKGINIPGISLPLPAMVEDDYRDLEFGCSQGIDYVAASFIRSREHVKEIKEFIASKTLEKIPVISKIEDREGVQNFDSILDESDGIMIARGDLGVEVDLWKIPRLQKMMIRKSIEASKVVITATQMLESMVHHPRPTRAEVSDVANAIYDLSSAVMLSAETAVGDYPIKTVTLMKKIITETEADIGYRENPIFVREDVAVHLKRLPGPFLSMTEDKRRYHQLSLHWGVIPIVCSNLEEAKAVALQQGLISKET